MRGLCVALLLSACSHATSTVDGATIATDAAMSPSSGDSAVAPGVDSAMSPSIDGTPTRQACTGNFGTGLSAAHGRLDGYLVGVLAPGTGLSCNGDDTHVHLQVMMQSAIYDVAVDIGATGDEIYYATRDMALPNGAWSEGWHTRDGLSYTSIGLSSTAFSELDPTTAATTVENALSSVNHISVYGTGYNQNGMHLVHYESGSDGALMLEPLSATVHALFFRFSSDHF